jgi:hypothetical protein
VRRALCSILILAALLAASLVSAQEQIPPITLGGGQSVTRSANGQTVEIVASGISATVNFLEISSTRVTGIAIRTSSGTSSGTVTIRWITRGKAVTLALGPPTPEVPFGMEGGDIDRRSGSQLTEP